MILTVNQFTGVIPKVDPTKLPNGAAQDALDCSFTTGALSGLPNHKTHSGYPAFKSGFVYVDLDGSKTIYGKNYDADFVRSPVRQDDYKRFYWTGINGGITEFRYALKGATSGGDLGASYKVGVAEFAYNSILVNGAVDKAGSVVSGFSSEEQANSVGGFTVVPSPPLVERGKLEKTRLQVFLADNTGAELFDITNQMYSVSGVGDQLLGWYKTYAIVLSKGVSDFTTKTVSSNSYTFVDVYLTATGSNATAQVHMRVWQKTVVAPDGTTSYEGAYGELLDGSKFIPEVVSAGNVKLIAGDGTTRSVVVLNETQVSVDGSPFPASLSSAPWVGSNSGTVEIPADAQIGVRFHFTMNGNDGVMTFFQDAGISQGSDDLGVGGTLSQGIDDKHWNINLKFGTSLGVEDRAYIFTFVNQLGEESGPFGLCQLSVDPGVDDVQFYFNQSRLNNKVSSATSGRYPLHGIRVYRTAAQAKEYFYVGCIRLSVVDLKGETYLPQVTSSGNLLVTDKVKGTALGSACDTIDSVVDVSELQKLQGLVTLYNGILAAFKGNEVWYCEPYKPWIFKRANVHTLDHRVVALLPLEQGVYVLTDKNPYYVSGATSDQMFPTKLTGAFPCVNKQAAALANGAAMYISPDGPVFVTGMDARLDTMAFSREAWRRDWDSYIAGNGTIQLAAYGYRLVAYFTQPTGAIKGYLYDVDTQAWTPISTALTSDMTVPPGTFGEWTDNLAFYTGSGDWQTFGTDETATHLWMWHSGDFLLPKPYNFGVVAMALSGTVEFTVYADGAQRSQQTVSSDGAQVIFRLPSGFLANKWSFKLRATASNTVVKYFHVATAGSELANV